MMTMALKMAASGQLTSNACCQAVNLALVTPYSIGEEAHHLMQVGHWHTNTEDDQMNIWFDALFGTTRTVGTPVATAAAPSNLPVQVATGAAAIGIVQKKAAQTTPGFFSTAYWRRKLTSDGVKQFIAGGIAGGVSRTVVSPLERMKILFQVQGPEPAQYRGVFGTLAKIWREEGMVGYMRGNGTNVIRIVPYSAVQFASYEQFKKMFMESGKDQLDTPRRLMAGACAGITSVAFTYPLDIVRTRLSVQSAEIGVYTSAAMSAMGAGEGNVRGPPQKLPGIWTTMRLMYREEGGLRALYRGLGPTMAVSKLLCKIKHNNNNYNRNYNHKGVAPYVALNFQAYEVLRAYFTRPGESSPSSVNKLLCGALAGSIAQTITYPLDVLRRRMQVTGMKEVGYKYRNTWHAIHQVITKEGILGLYKGMIPNYLKVAPAIGVSFWCYELCKDLFGSK
ncbi:mitochondrial carrier domain-containing protein [Syncephalis fuscata]|nr:mitochondrial carrier domain-containing protein [Syncephalis fuscata]